VIREHLIDMGQLLTNIALALANPGDLSAHHVPRFRGPRLPWQVALGIPG
jgi:hypothetical protein